MTQDTTTPAMRKAGRIYREMQSEIKALRRQGNRDGLTFDESTPQFTAEFMLAVAQRLENLQREMGFLVLDIIHDAHKEESDGYDPDIHRKKSDGTY